MFRILVIVLLLLVFTLAAYGIDIYSYYGIADGIVLKTKTFSYLSDGADGRMLFVGDSTAVGIGAENPSLSVAGRFSKDFPDFEIINLSKSGAKTEDVLLQLRSAEGDFDLVVIQSGANDVLYFTSEKKVTNATRTLLKEAREISDNVVFLFGGNLGLAPLFVPPLDWIYSYRARNAHNRFETIANEEDAIFVNLFFEDDDPFVEDFDRYYAPDLLHLNGNGYAIWYDLIRKAMTSAGVETL